MRKHRVLIVELGALAAAVIAAVLVTVVAPGSQKHALPFAPSVLGAQPPGAVVLAQEDEDLAVALALKPGAGGLLAVITVLGQDGAGAEGLTTSVSVRTADGRSTTSAAAQGALGTYQAVLATRARPTGATVSIDGPGSSDRPLRFALPATWPAKPATALMKKVDNAYAQLKTLVTHERLASDPTHVIDSVYRAISPSTLQITSSNGTQAIVIGDRRWDKQPGSGFKESAQSPPVKAIAPYWAGIVEDPTLLGSTTVRGRPAWIVSFAAPQIPAFFQIDVDKATDRTLVLEMTASAHFMHHSYGPFDSRLAIRPPR
jgi:hypothetical protein